MDEPVGKRAFQHPSGTSFRRRAIQRPMSDIQIGNALSDGLMAHVAGCAAKTGS